MPIGLQPDALVLDAFPAGQVRGEVPKETENESVDRVGSLTGDLDTVAWRKSDSSSQYEKLAFYH